MTNRELLSLLKEKNRIAMPVLLPNDVAYVTVQKSSLEEFVKELDPKAKAPWEVISTKDGLVTLDLAD